MILLTEDKLLTRTYCDEAGGYGVPNVLSPLDLVFRPDFSDIKLGHQRTCTMLSKSLTKVCVCVEREAFLPHHGGVFTYKGSPLPLEYYFVGTSEETTRSSLQWLNV